MLVNGDYSFLFHDFSCPSLKMMYMFSRLCLRVRNYKTHYTDLRCHQFSWETLGLYFQWPVLLWKNAVSLPMRFLVSAKTVDHVKRWSGNMNAVLHNSQKPQEIISFFSQYVWTIW